MKATIIIVHNEQKETQIKPMSITLITKSGKEKQMEWNHGDAIYKHGVTHFVTGGIKIKDTDDKNAMPITNMDWVKRNIKHAYLSEIQSLDGQADLKSTVKLKSCILCEMQPDNTKTHYGIPIKYE